MSETNVPQPPCDALVSVLAVVHNAAPVLPEFIAEVQAVLQAHCRYYEIVMIDLQSSDHTVPIILEHMERVPHLRLLRISTRSDLEVGMAAGLDHCIGDYAVLMSPYHDRPSDIPRMLALALEGHDVVVAKRTDVPGDRFLRRMFYRLASQMLEIELDPSESSFRLLSRKVVSSMTKIKNRRRYLRYFNALLNYKKATLACTMHERSKRLPTKPRLLRSARHAADILISHSAAPLRWTAALGVVATFGNLAYLLYILVVALVKTRLAEGWLTTSVMMSSMFFCLFLMLAVLAEYVARIMEESQDRPLYFIEMEAESSVSSAAAAPLNVVEAQAWQPR